MANKLSRALGNIETKLKELVTDGSLRAVERRVIRPFQEMQLPVLGIKITQYGRQAGKVWTADVVLMLATQAGAGADDEPNIDLAGKVDKKIQALADSGSAQCLIDAPTWEPWEAAREGGALAPIGNLGGLKITVDEPLLLVEEVE